MPSTESRLRKEGFFYLKVWFISLLAYALLLANELAGPLFNMFGTTWPFIAMQFAGLLTGALTRGMWRETRKRRWFMAVWGPLVGSFLAGLLIYPPFMLFGPIYAIACWQVTLPIGLLAVLILGPEKPEPRLCVAQVA